MAGAWIEHATQGFSVPRSTTELPGQKQVEHRIIKISLIKSKKTFVNGNPQSILLAEIFPFGWRGVFEYFGGSS